MKKQQFGAGIWHFATYVDRYATDGYGEPRSVLDAIELAGLDLTEFYSEEELAVEQEIDRLKTLSFYQ